MVQLNFILAFVIHTCGLIKPPLGQIVTGSYICNLWVESNIGSLVFGLEDRVIER